jgi:NifU-like protein involved in Fe-S cluster formation
MSAFDERVVKRAGRLRFRIADAKAFAKGVHGFQAVVGSDANALCGDMLDVAVLVERNERKAIIRDVRYSGYGCALCLASADLLSERLRGSDVAWAVGLEGSFMKALWNGLDVGRARADCMTLPMRALQNALEGVADEEAGLKRD